MNQNDDVAESQPDHHQTHDGTAAKRDLFAWMGNKSASP
jgi:hypothetical protein